MISVPRRIPRFFSFGLLAALFFHVAAARADTFYVSNWGNNTITKYDATGAFLGTFASTHLNHPTGLAFSPSGNLFVANSVGNTIVQFNGATGAFVGTFASTHLDTPMGLAFSSSGNLFVANSDGNTIAQFNGVTGAFVGTFASTHLARPFGLTFSSGGNLFVADALSGNVVQFNGTTGAFAGIFASSPGAAPLGLTFSPGGNLAVVYSPGPVAQYNGTTGALVGSPSTDGLNNPCGIAFSSSGNFFVTNCGQILLGDFYANTTSQYNGTTGAFVNTFASTGLDWPFFIAPVVKDNNFLPPWFSTQAANLTVTAGATATFTVAATGGPYFRWQRKAFGSAAFANLNNGGAYSGVTTATLTVSNTTTLMSGGRFRCVATGVGGSTTSNAAILTVQPHVIIIRQPLNVSVKTKSTARFSVTATGPRPLRYQWLHDSVTLENSSRITGALAATLVLTKTTLDDAGNYSVVVSGGSGAAGSIATSNRATLTVNP